MAYHEHCIVWPLPCIVWPLPGLKRCQHDGTLCGGIGGSGQSYRDCVVDHERKLVHKKRQFLGQLDIVFLIHLLLCIHLSIFGISLLYVRMHVQMRVCVCAHLCE